MPVTLDALRTHSRFVCRIAAREIFAATLDLSRSLPRTVVRARSVCIPILVAVTRDSLDRHVRGLDTGQGASVSAIAASLDLPFETVRRNLLRLERLGWVAHGDAGGIIAPAIFPSELARWTADLAARMGRLGREIDAADIIPTRLIDRQVCDKQAALIGLDLFLVMAGTSKRFDLRFAELLLVHYICNESVRELAHDRRLAVSMSLPDSVPPDVLRAFVPFSQLAADLGVSRSTLYRMAADCEDRQLLERRDSGVRATAAFLGSPGYRASLELVAGRIAMLFARLRRHQCVPACAALHGTRGETIAPHLAASTVAAAQAGRI